MLHPCLGLLLGRSSFLGQPWRNGALNGQGVRLGLVRLGGMNAFRPVAPLKVLHFLLQPGRIGSKLSEIPINSNLEQMRETRKNTFGVASLKR